MYGRSRVNVKVEPRSTFPFTRDRLYITSIIFTRVKFTCVRTEKLRNSGNQQRKRLSLLCCFRWPVVMLVKFSNMRKTRKQKLALSNKRSQNTYPSYFVGWSLQQETSDAHPFQTSIQDFHLSPPILKHAVALQFRRLSDQNNTKKRLPTGSPSWR